ncbi:unnamed protein product [Chrysoparadoxa australica]
MVRLCFAALALGAGCSQVAAFAPSGLWTATRRVSTTMMSHTLDGKPIDGELKPLSSWILVEVKPKMSETVGGIIVPGKAQELPNEGVVQSMGPGKRHEETGLKYPMPCNIGDKVLYGKYDGTSLQYDGKPHQFVRDQDIIFVYDGETMTEKNIKMINDQILVRVTEDDTVTKGGLILAPQGDPDMALVKPSLGVISSVGPGKMNPEGKVVAPAVKVGDEVKFRKFAGTELKLDGSPYRVMKDEDILAKW